MRRQMELYFSAQKFISRSKRAYYLWWPSCSKIVDFACCKLCRSKDITCGLKEVISFGRSKEHNVEERAEFNGVSHVILDVFSSSGKKHSQRRTSLRTAVERCQWSRLHVFMSSTDKSIRKKVGIVGKHRHWANSEQTLGRVLHNMDEWNNVTEITMLAHAHKNTLLEYVKSYKHSTVGDWKVVIWSDEYRFWQ